MKPGTHLLAPLFMMAFEMENIMMHDWRFPDGTSPVLMIRNGKMQSLMKDPEERFHHNFYLP